MLLVCVVAVVVMIVALGFLIAAPIALHVTQNRVWEGIAVSAFILAVVALIVAAWSGGW